ncbi:CDC48 family AAA ATPase [Prosthecochloris sp. CIB 2401]|uniref:CDC48 family AAA ATPase n=1 Tax=Prosthecochloris sp. CIB 2401 TaxID=1868325 RepID=UPI00080AA29E|nr:ATP-dependent zinc metalloprotease FtsH [Prosthecochloris sp. CIB 2401]
MTSPVTTFCVHEALAKDAGRSIARIEPGKLKELGLELGEVVLLEDDQGRGAVPVRIMPLYPNDREPGAIQIDPILRDTLKVMLGEAVRLHAVTSQSARKITVRRFPTGEQARTKTSLPPLFLEGIPVCSGQVLRPHQDRLRGSGYSIVSTIPSGVVVITTDTIIQLDQVEKTGNQASGLSYQNIGGLGNQLHRIKEMIELPLLYPEIFQRLGIDPPKGVLLHGPPGTGKTLIARTVANETNAHFISVSGPEIMGKFYGESEGRLRKIFEEAQRHAPAIIFMDEIDAIAPRREDMGGEKQVERRVVAQLLALMDGLNSRGQVIVIAATNLPDSLDNALRRPGRFDREIVIPVPDKYGRHEILQVHTRGMPLADDVDLSRLADITHGFVGADLEAFCREAAMSALRTALPQLQDDTMSGITPEAIANLYISMADFMKATKDVEPSAIRDVFVEIPDVTWKNVGGLFEIKHQLREAVEWPLKYSSIFEAAAAKPPKGILLFGRPGTGKTLIAKAVANESGANFIAIKGSKLMGQYIGEAEKGVSEVFRKARQAEPTILFIDEIESLLPKRGSRGDGSGVTDRVISQFLVEMDGIEEMHGVTVLAATNRINMIDEALLRSGRFELHIEIPYPDQASREDIFRIHTAKKPLAPNVDMDELALLTDGMSGADIEFICRKATALMIRDYITQQDNLYDFTQVSEFESLSIGREYFITALEGLKAMKLNDNTYLES